MKIAEAFGRVDKVVVRTGGEVTVYAKIRRHTAGSLYAATRYHRLHRRAL